MLDAARALDISRWTDAQLEEATEYVTTAHGDLARADRFERLATNLRIGGLRQEAARRQKGKDMRTVSNGWRFLFGRRD